PVLPFGFNKKEADLK
ncbi:unnamed protein product, partial [Allacma fusca]